MLYKVGTLGEAFPADGASIRRLSCVGSPMYQKAGALLEAFATIGALVRFQPRVVSLVSDKT